MKIEEGDDAALSDAAAVDSTQLVYGSLPILTTGTTSGSAWFKEGVHSTKRYVRASIDSTATSSGATISMVAILDAELIKTSQTG